MAVEGEHSFGWTPEGERELGRVTERSGGEYLREMERAIASPLSFNSGFDVERIIESSRCFM